MQKNCIWLLLHFFIQVHSDIDVSREEYATLPKVFDFNDTDNCPDDHVQCKIIIKFEPIDRENPSKTWKIIRKITDDKRYFRRDLVYRGGCVDQKNVTKNYKEHMEKGLVGKIDEMYCVGRLNFIELLDSIDIAFGLLSACYLILIVFCTIKSYSMSGSRKTHDSDQMSNRYIQNFSLIYIWKQIRKPKISKSFDQLKSLHGMRTLAMILILIFHTFVAMLLSYSTNPEYVENFFFHPTKKIFTGLFGLLVQIFFIISGWLLAVKLHEIIGRNSEFTLTDILVLTVNRYFRLIPAVIVSVFLARSATMGALIHPLYHYNFQREQQRCLYGWWRTILFTHISCESGHLCLPYTWYIVADTQMYILLCLFFYVSQKLRIPVKYFLLTVVTVAMCIQFHTVITTEFNGLLRINPRYLEPESGDNIIEFVLSYARTITNIATYVIGFTFGTIYYRNKQQIIFDTSIKKLFWYIAFFGFPFISSLLYNLKTPRLLEAVLAVTLRPIFGLGIAIGFLGMTTGPGGYIRNLFQWSPLVFFGDFVYSIFSFNYFIIFGRMRLGKIAEHSDLFYLKNAVSNIVLSFLIGILMYIILEYPCIELQKMVLPQLKMKKQSKNE